MRNRSFAGPLVLIALGALFLVSNLVPDLSVWQLLGSWWPLLLIAFGLIRVFEVLISYQKPARSPLDQGVRPVGFGWIFAVVVIGLALSVPRHINPNWHIKAAGVNIFGQDYTYPTTRITPIGSAKRLVLDNLRGNISVNGSDVSEIRVEGQKLVHAYDRNAADLIDHQSKLDLIPEGDVLFLRATEPSNPDQGHLSVELEIVVPRGIDVEARGKSGDLTVNSIQGAVDVSSQRGEIHLQDVGGNTKLDVERADLVHASGLKGSLDIEGKGRDIQLENVAGPVMIQGDFSGTLDFRQIAQTVHFESGRTDLVIDKLPGSMSMDLSNLRIEGGEGAVRFSTGSRDVHLEDFSGPVTIEVGRGDIELKPATAKKLARMDVRSRDGNITVSLPANGQFALNAVSQKGEISNDYGDGIVSSSEEKGGTMKSANPSGPEIALNTTRGTITVNKLD